MNSVTSNEPKTLTDRLRVLSKGILEPICRFLNRLGIKPNTVTLIGLLGNVIAAYLIAMGQMTWGGVVMLLLGAFDALDGTLARISDQVTKFGGLLDSVIDRYSELVVMGGLLLFFTQKQDTTSIILVYLAAAGSVLVSYVKARAEGLGMECKVGLLTRVERYIVMVVTLIFNIPVVGLWIIAILANITAVQRIWHVYSKSKASNNGNQANKPE